eukprot:scaffold180436_cov18-Tisochrysis_lutea.AAC.1
MRGMRRRGRQGAVVGKGRKTAMMTGVTSLAAARSCSSSRTGEDGAVFGVRVCVYVCARVRVCVCLCVRACVFALGAVYKRILQAVGADKVADVFAGRYDYESEPLSGMHR